MLKNKHSSCVCQFASVIHISLCIAISHQNSLYLKMSSPDRMDRHTSPLALKRSGETGRQVILAWQISSLVPCGWYYLVALEVRHLQYHSTSTPLVQLQEFSHETLPNFFTF